tara:strand:+ start:226 stop:513 length:288 start_codon:yes stop_codon:yes gene_type:complete
MGASARNQRQRPQPVRRLALPGPQQPRRQQQAPVLRLDEGVADHDHYLICNEQGATLMANSYADALQHDGPTISEVMMIHRRDGIISRVPWIHPD